MEILEAMLAGVESVEPTGRRALILPVLPGLRPGLEVYENAVFPLRGPLVDVYGLTLPFGPLPEDSLYVYGDLLDFVVQDRQIVEDEGTIRTRAWLDAMAPVYDRFVLFSYQPATTLRPWTRAISWSPAAKKTRIVPMSRYQKITDPIVQNKLRLALGLPKARPQPAGLWTPGETPWDDGFDPGSPFEDVFDDGPWSSTAVSIGPLPRSDVDVLGAEAVTDDRDVLEAEDPERGSDPGDPGSPGREKEDFLFDEGADPRDILGSIGRVVPGNTRGGR